jgi:putative NIF3 family GTP cyclohydrolase 1 type 2
MRLRDILEWSALLAGCETVPADSQVYLESHDDVRRVLFGIDIGLGEILYARDAGFDAVIAHHPVGDRAQIDFSRVVWRQVEQMTAEGIARDVAEAAVTERIARPERALHIGNVNRTVDTARLIGLPLANIHLACDIITRQTIVDLLAARARPASTVSDAIEWLAGIPEIAAGFTRPQAWLGDPSLQLGRYTVAIAGGTNGGYPVFREYYRAGVDTIIAMHIADEDLARLREDPVAEGCTLLVTGHMSADSIGINRVIAGLEERGIAVTRTSGIVAPSRRD